MTNYLDNNREFFHHYTAHRAAFRPSVAYHHRSGKNRCGNLVVVLGRVVHGDLRRGYMGVF